MKTLAAQINRELEDRKQAHCAIYEHELQRLWPLNQKDREAMIVTIREEVRFPFAALQKGLVRNLRQTAEESGKKNDATTTTVAENWSHRA